MDHANENSHYGPDVDMVTRAPGGIVADYFS